MGVTGFRKINYEFKAYCNDFSKVISLLKEAGAINRGLDLQKDTYFKVNAGRLKLREGSIKSYLIWYDRPNVSRTKKSDVLLFEPGDPSVLKEILMKSLGVNVVVEKRRQIFSLKNIKIHMDSVEGLGNFVEVEAQGEPGDEAKLHQQCEEMKKQLILAKEDFVSCSYCDLLVDLGQTEVS